MDIHALWESYIRAILLIFVAAGILHLLSGRIAGHVIRLSGYAPEAMRPTEERRHTLQDLLASAISLAGFLIAIVYTIGLFIDTTTLVWMIGLFSAAFGLGARPLISDFLTGLSFIFESSLDVGEKVEILGVEGVIEKINLRTLLIRSPTGELYIIPNGEVRVIRNFSRGRFSTADMKVKINTDHLNEALVLLETLGHEAMILLPNLLEPWQVINTSGEVGEHTELRLVAKSKFGQAATMRPRLLALVHERLNDAGIKLID